MDASYADELRRTDLFIWDEISMVPRWALQSVHQLCRDLMSKPDVPFGGKTIVVGGDSGKFCKSSLMATKPDVLSATAKTFTGVCSLSFLLRSTNGPKILIFENLL
jgi:hypothetical protein